MERARFTGLALTASLALTGLACAPAALVAQDAQAAPRPKTRSHQPTTPPPPPPTPCPTPRSYPASHLQGVPWAQAMLKFTNAWPRTKGRGVKIAVVDSGVDRTHPQLAGKVVKHVDLTHTHDTDCYGHGTEVAGIIVGRDERNTKAQIPFVGVAPEAQIISVKVQDGENSGDNGTLLARGIEEAVNYGADIINVSIFNTDYPLLRHAVRYAQQHDVLIVAAAGNWDPAKKAGEQEAYPATYRGVLSVGALDQNGAVASFSNDKSRVDVAAPGANITSTVARGYVGQLDGTSFAAPYVAGVAALVKASHRRLTSQQIINRIVRTAGGSVGPGSGNGIVNPYLAVTDPGNDNAGPSPTRQAVAQPVDIGGPAPVDHHARTVGGIVAVAALGGTILVVFGGVVAPMGARRKWRPGRAPALATDYNEDAE